MAKKSLQLWDLWYPQAAASGLPFARGRMDPTDVLLVHAPPPMLTVEVRGDDGSRLAFSADLPQTADRPMARLTRVDDLILREDIWPAKEDLGLMMILPGGEVGQLLEWWNAEDGSEWRWRIEFYNHR